MTTCKNNFLSLLFPVIFIGKSDVIDLQWNAHEDNFDDCFRYWEIRSFGVLEKIIKFSKSPKLQDSKQRKQIKEVTMKL